VLTTIHALERDPHRHSVDTVPDQSRRNDLMLSQLDTCENRDELDAISNKIQYSRHSFANTEQINFCYFIFTNHWTSQVEVSSFDSREIIFFVIAAVVGVAVVVAIDKDVFSVCDKSTSGGKGIAKMSPAAVADAAAILPPGVSTTFIVSSSITCSCIFLFVRTCVYCVIF
jgi:hypothetical protein